MRSILFDPQTMSEANMPLIAKNPEIFRPRYLSGYPNAIYLLARYFKNHGAPSFELEAIMTGSGQLYDQQKELFHKADAIIVTKNRRRILGRSIPQRFLADLGVKQYQLVQENYEELVARLVLDKHYPQGHKEQVIREIKARYEPIFADEININVQFVEQIPPAKSGKREVVISKLPPCSHSPRQ